MSETTETVDTAAATRDERDELTGLWTRGAFFLRAEEAFAESLERQVECVAVVVDLDRLELVNNTFGHHVGSELIREAAAALEAAALEGDLLGRLGGDELALLRTAADSDPAALRERIEAEVRRAGRSERAYGLDVSVGVAGGRPGAARSLDELMFAADQDMYRQKQARGGLLRGPHARRRSRD